MCRRPKKGHFFLGPLREAPYGEGRSLRGREGPYGEGSLTGRVAPFTKKEGEEAYGKAALYGKPFTGRDGPYEKAGPYEQGRSLRKGPGCRTLTGSYGEGLYLELGREFPLVCRRPKKAVFFLGSGRFWPFCPLRALTGSPLRGRDGPYEKGPLRDGPYEKGRSLTGRAGVPYGSFTEKDERRGLREGRALMGSPLQEERSLREGPVLTGRATGRQGVREAPYKEERSLREGPVLTRLGPFVDKNDL